MAELEADDILESLGLHPAQRQAQDHLLSLVREGSASSAPTLEQPQPAPAPSRTIGQPASNSSIASPTAKAVGDMGAVPPPMTIKRPSMFSDAENRISEHHPFWGGVLKGLDVTGRILSPGLTAQIPGTSLNQQMQEGIESHKQEQGLEQKKTQAETEESQAKTAKTQKETEQLGKADASDVKYEKTDSGSIIALKHDPLTDKVSAEVVYQGDAKNPKDAFQLWLKQNPNGKAEDFLSAQQTVKAKPLDAGKAQQLNTLWNAILKKHGLPTDQFHEGMTDADAKELESGFNSVLGKQQGDTKVSIDLSGLNLRKTEAQDKKIAPLQAQIDEVANARELKKMGDAGNAAADVDLTLSFFKMMRSATSGSSGIRFTQQEQNLIMGARSLWESLQVQGNKVFSNGQPLSSEQRQRMLDVMELHAKSAQRAIDRLQGGGKSESDESVEEYERDASGKLVKKKK